MTTSKSRVFAVAVLLIVTACGSREGAVVASKSGLPAKSPGENVVTIKVLGSGKYAVDAATGIGQGQLQSAVASRYAGGSGTRVVRVLGYPGVTGYDVVMAVNAARAAGARRVDGIAEYTDDGSSGNNKVWSEPMEPLPASAGADTVRH